jgi:hypothetical protein
MPTFEFRGWLTGVDSRGDHPAGALSPGVRRITPHPAVLPLLCYRHGIERAGPHGWNHLRPESKFDSLSPANAGLLLLSAAVSGSHLRAHAIEKNEASERLIACSTQHSDLGSGVFSRSLK